MRTEPRHQTKRLALLAVLTFLFAPVCPSRGAVDHQAEEALLKIEAVLEMADLSQAVWPGWDISATPFALHCPDGFCYLVNHPDPPEGFEPVGDETSVRGATVFRAPLTGVEDDEPCLVGGVPTAVVDFDGFCEEALPQAFEAAFRAYEMALCPNLSTPITLAVGYPSDSQALVSADIECLLLRRAASAPDDSLAQYVQDFTSVRKHRRLRMGRRYAEYERRIEFGEGIARYVADLCRETGRAHLVGPNSIRLEDSVGEPYGLESGLEQYPGPTWYRVGRFRWTGALLCKVMDRLDPGWKETSSRDCTDPFELILRITKGKTSPPRMVLARYGYEELVAARAAEIERSKTGSLRMFERITESTTPLFTIDTHLLASGEVRFDPSGIERVDAHREVHTRLFQIEYSGGTYIHVIGHPVAVTLGDDEFDFRRLAIIAPDTFSVVLDGEELPVEDGIYQFTRLLSVTGEGFSMEAQAGTVMIGAKGISFILHR